MNYVLFAEAEVIPNWLSPVFNAGAMGAIVFYMLWYGLPKLQKMHEESLAQSRSDFQTLTNQQRTDYLTDTQRQREMQAKRDDQFLESLEKIENKCDEGHKAVADKWSDTISKFGDDLKAVLKEAENSRK